MVFYESSECKWQMFQFGFILKKAFIGEKQREKGLNFN
ncbi:hypothetical protein OVS_02790 [Mycoplasma ovis str. Michigan]|uniref:Uncharacterized protein n=1 Tax=Mycoplasma ovis str. Michigan TaxID=1415773 RepID=A0ABM5P208_9MOLU|nr:hypothetical protein OVS_02790 [Mycoplasma ovis str. Michigan]